MKTNLNFPTTAPHAVDPVVSSLKSGLLRGPLSRALLVFSLLFSVFQPAVFAQTGRDQSVAASIAPYSATVRQAILSASQYPEILSQLQQNRTQTQQAFQNLVGGFNQTKQGWFYELTRYPDVLHTLASEPTNLSTAAVENLLPKSATDELKTAAWKLYHNHHADLVQADQLNQQAGQTFEQVIQPLDAPVQDAFRQLISLPDVMTLLTDQLDLTRQLGDQYRAEGPALVQQLTALHDSLSVQDQYEVSAFQQELADNPQAGQELNQAAQDYAKSNGYIIPPVPADNTPTTTYSYNYFANPYSYWFGYPGWYGSPLWYPGAYWAGFGFGFGLGTYGLYGFPTYGFSNWFFNRGYYRSYPHLYRQFGSYYQHNVAQNRVLGSVNSGFMRVAQRHYNPNASGRLNFLTSPGAFSRPAGIQNQAGARVSTFSHPNANVYHAQGWGGFSNHGFTSGGFRGGGFHGGGRR
ncbi:hypothetical protein [Larkinella rosea]|uniref:DUF3300 domain-containing protein n=1 Tax=Larkinella rosea TaxID=2025312 RepID=A0A3P1BVB9_9BACT|nr:hypothetical protein [Larkinella rosea]RRB04803.1 hypothetical protein EHT25_15170 [Larkinella rosea]